MSATHARYILIETIISILINVAISGLFMMAVFGHDATIALWGSHGLAFDFVPQTFMISAMSILVPTLITRRRIRRGVIGASSTDTSPLIDNLLLRILLISIALTLIAGGTATFILNETWSAPIPYAQALRLKLVYGGLVALIATPLGLSMAFAEKSKEKT